MTENIKTQKLSTYLHNHIELSDVNRPMCYLPSDFNKFWHTT